MAHHKIYIFLRQGIKRYAFGTYPAYKFMVYFSVACLVGSVLVAVIYVGAAFSVFIELNFGGVGKFAAVGCKNYREQLHKRFSAESVIYISLNISVTDLAVLASRRYANIKPVETKYMVSNTAPVLLPFTESI